MFSGERGTSGGLLISSSACCHPAAVCDNKKWDAFDEAITPDAVVYIINLSEYPASSLLLLALSLFEALSLIPTSYDQFSPQDKTQNKLQTAIDVLTDFCTTKTFKSCSHMIVLLNCLDLFMEKAAAIDLKCCFNEYTGILSLSEGVRERYLYYFQQMVWIPRRL